MREHTLDPAHVEWCRRLFYMIRVGGVWGVPRSGLIFTRTDETTLTLTDRMPYMAGMESLLTPAELDEQQAEEYAACAEYFRAAGVTVLDTTKERADAHWDEPTGYCTDHGAYDPEGNCPGCEAATKGKQ
jgi:hypothetical protein